MGKPVRLDLIGESRENQFVHDFPYEMWRYKRTLYHGGVKQGTPLSMKMLRDAKRKVKKYTALEAHSRQIVLRLCGEGLKDHRTCRRVNVFWGFSISFHSHARTNKVWPCSFVANSLTGDPYKRNNFFSCLDLVAWRTIRVKASRTFIFVARKRHLAEMKTSGDAFPECDVWGINLSSSSPDTTIPYVRVENNIIYWWNVE